MKAPARVWRGVFNGIMSEDMPIEPGRVDAPTLIVWGDQDAYCPRQDQEKLLQAFRKSRLVVYEGLGHATHWEDPKRVAGDIVAFVDSLGQCFRPARSDNFAQATGRDIVDETVNGDVGANHRRGSDGLDIDAHGFVWIADWKKVDIGDIGAEVGEQFSVHLLVGDLAHPTVGVVDDQELTSAEQAIGDDERPDCVLAGAPARVANDVGVTLLKAQDTVWVDPRVHTGQDRQLQPG